MRPSIIKNMFYTTIKLSLVISGLAHGVPNKAPIDLVNIFMGTNNEGASFSRGNQYPAIHVPFGMHAFSPRTSTNRTTSWFYDYDARTFTGVRMTHQPSVWAGDYSALEFMPALHSKGEHLFSYKARTDRYLSSDRSGGKEIGSPFYYRYHLPEANTLMEVTPSDHGALFRISYPTDSSKTPYLILNGKTGRKPFRFEISQAFKDDPYNFHGMVWSQGNSDYTNNAQNMAVFFHVVSNTPIEKVETSEDHSRAAILFKDNSDGTPVLLKLATSYLSEEQAAQNLNSDFKASSENTFVQARHSAKEKWQEYLDKIVIQGGKEADRRTFYSALYRVYAFPKKIHEPYDEATGRYHYRSPFDGRRHEGKMWVGNGFWDTYRGVWPFLTMMHPTLTGEMLDGWVSSYKQGGWTVRWSNPGYWDCMISTHTDIIFADAYLKGIRNWDYHSGFQASLKNALVDSPGGGRGRAGAHRYNFLGYIPWQETGGTSEPVARTLEHATNDFGIAQFAAALGNTNLSRYFKNRAMSYINLWDKNTRFFRPRREGVTTDGTPIYRSKAFNPQAWRLGFTEGNAWHYRFAPMYDGTGLAALFGGRAKMAAALDQLLATRVPSDLNTIRGGYPRVIHEMREAALLSPVFGEFAIGNQPAQHILHMYAHTTTPAKTQLWVQKALAKAFSSGMSNGFGYPGDEDNGQTSVWFVMNALGFYSAAPGYPEYTLTTPIFDRIDLSLEDGETVFTILIDDRQEGSPENYIETASLNGQNWATASLPYAAIQQGGTLRLKITSDAQHMSLSHPASLTASGAKPTYVGDLLNETNAPAAAKHLIDDNSRTKLAVTDPTQFSFASRQPVNFVSVTAADNLSLSPKRLTISCLRTSEMARELEFDLHFTAQRQTNLLFFKETLECDGVLFRFAQSSYEVAELEVRHLSW